MRFTYRDGSFDDIQTMGQWCSDNGIDAHFTIEVYQNGIFKERWRQTYSAQEVANGQIKHINNDDGTSIRVLGPLVILIGECDVELFIIRYRGVVEEISSDA